MPKRTRAFPVTVSSRDSAFAVIVDEPAAVRRTSGGALPPDATPAATFVMGGEIAKTCPGQQMEGATADKGSARRCVGWVNGTAPGATP